MDNDCEDRVYRHRMEDCKRGRMSSSCRTRSWQSDVVPMSEADSQISCKASENSSPKSTRANLLKHAKQRNTYVEIPLSCGPLSFQTRSDLHLRIMIFLTYDSRR